MKGLEAEFTNAEIKEFLENRGYSIKKHKYSTWEQWGNHDNQGEWKERSCLCAVRRSDKLGLESEYKEVFKKEITKKLKKILLS